MAAVVAPAGGFTVVTHTYPQHAQQPTSGTAPTVDHHKFLIGKPMALGTVQIMIGVVVLLFGVVNACYAMTISIFSGVMFWGAIIYMVAGGLTVGASKSPNLCLVRASLGMNIFSTITAGIAIILHSFDFVFIGGIYGCYRAVQGIAGVMLVLSVLQFIVSICVSAFACKATSCCTDTQQVRYMSSQAIPTTHQAAASLNPQVMYLPNQGSSPSCPPVCYSTGHLSDTCCLPTHRGASCLQQELRA
ncbi:membrane-spanning 4-domains subfamily A member 4A-like [Engraulis encrasicolus]|uniref:membrane-spanning 4-domains subfamily A member 4A-like n=1 Tax=Engraulis encrasicolus TaxID=184585 RepID=UPI002FD77F35